MYIYVDESGTFTAPEAANQDSWCVVAAYVSPERDQARLNLMLEQLRKDCGGGDEIKLNHISEARYIRFLRDLSKFTGLAFAVAVDISLHSKDAVSWHRSGQAGKIIEHRDKMLHDEMKRQLDELSCAFLSLPLQLYTQLQCQVELFYNVVNESSIYYSQHVPETLGSFRWRVDRKNTIPTAYEDAFAKILPAALQSKSLKKPMICLAEGNYDSFNRFQFAEGNFPNYLKDDYGLEVSQDGIDVGKIVREDFQLVDSAQSPGVQVADLIASGLRRLLRGGFERGHEIALGLSANMVSKVGGMPQIQLISLGKEAQTSLRTEAILELLERKTKPLI